jgi:hypothetical protein
MCYNVNINLKGNDMYKVNKQKKTLEKICETTFNEIKCKERYDLQEWIVSNPSILGEELLIIQKEFSGFENTNERLDLLAMDRYGNLVVIENKTDDTGKDVVWQAVKYASYCSTLSNNDIKKIYAQYLQKYCSSSNSSNEAETKILDFLNKDDFDGIFINKPNTQRIILVAHEFRKEVLSAAQWLLNFKIDISCIKILPLIDGDTVYLDTDQILPQPDTKDYTLKLANKAIEDQAQQKSLVKSERLRNDFWKFFIPEFNKRSDLFKNISYDRTDHWLGTAANMISGLGYNFLICKNYCGVELAISNNDKNLNKKIFDALYSKKIEINEKLKNYTISWERLDDRCMSRICVRNEELSLYQTDCWDKISDFLCAAMIDFEAVFKNYATLVKAQSHK